MISEQQAWAILFLPLASFLLIVLLVRPFLYRRLPWASGLLTVVAVGAAFLLSLWAVRSVVVAEGVVGWPSHQWLVIGDLEVRMGILMNPLTAVMLVVVTGVSFLVQVYSLAYMRREEQPRFFAYMSLFTASMVGILLARSILQLYVFWELVGLSSYLLIGFWYHRPAAAAAAKKAFIVTRIGDVGFLMSILYLFLHRDLFLSQGLNPLEIPDILSAAPELAGFTVTWLALGIFAGAVGKSGQFPLHTWLPDAMEGPTPVSALIHAATMVAAGVFLMARFFPLVAESDVALTVVALTGGFTVVFAASMALVMYDIKRVLAYSTISQLGYMMLAVGIGAPEVAIFHLFTHAFFKALLFLGAGSVNHATGTYDMRYMGGLRRPMPLTYVTFVIGALSLAGVFPLAGFWSKDEILLQAWRGGGVVDQLVFWLSMFGVLLTAFYMSRVVFMTFHGSFRGGADAEPQEQETHGQVHLSESPIAMAAPLVVLAAAAIVVGYVVNPLTSLAGIPGHWLVEFLGGHGASLNVGLAVASTAVVLAGIGLAARIYLVGAPSPERVGGALRPLRQLLIRKYYIDDLYEGVVTNQIFYRGIARFLDWVDREVVDRTVDFIGWLSRQAGPALAPIQNGQVQGYGIVGSIGILVIVAIYLLIGG